MRISDWSSDVCSSDLLVAMLQPFQAVVRPRDHPRAVEHARRAGIERVDDQARLAAARQAGDASEGAERALRGDVLEVVGARALQHQVEAIALAEIGSAAGGGEVW